MFYNHYDINNMVYIVITGAEALATYLAGSGPRIGNGGGDAWHNYYHWHGFGRGAHAPARCPLLPPPCVSTILDTNKKRMRLVQYITRTIHLLRHLLSVPRHKHKADEICIVYYTVHTPAMPPFVCT